MKTKNLIGLGAVILAATGLAAYALTRPTPPGPALSMEEISPLPPATYEDNAAYYDIAAHYPQVTPLKARVSAASDAAAVSAMKAWVMDTVNQFKKDGRFDSLTAKDKEMLGFDGGRKWTLDILYLISTSPRTVSYIFTVNQDTGGAHGNTLFKTFTFDTKTGALLSIGDLFTRTDYLVTLSTVAREKLPGVIGEFAVPSDIALGTTPEEKNFTNFFLDNGTLNILFPPYQVAAYAAGPQTLPIPLTELGGALKTEYAPR